MFRNADKEQIVVVKRNLGIREKKKGRKIVTTSKEIKKETFLPAHIVRRQITQRDIVDTGQMLSAGPISNKGMLKRFTRIVVPRWKKKLLLLNRKIKLMKKFCLWQK